MSWMIPPVLETNSPGERRLFHEFKNAPQTEDWIVLHSLDIASHPTQLSGEIDFVVIIPGHGILCLEVKGGKVSREGGIWVSQSGKVRSTRSPFTQASNAMHAIRRYLADNDSRLANILIFSAVVFTAQEFSEESPEWHRWQVLDRVRLSTVLVCDWCLFVLKQAHRKAAQSPSSNWYDSKNSRPDQQQAKKILQLLRGDFEYFLPRKSLAKENENAILRYTQNQFSALDAMEGNDRVLFQGLAGTGKTILALETMRRNTLLGNKSAMLCYNNLLGEHLANEVPKPDRRDGFVGTFHSFLLSLVEGRQVSVSRSARFWAHELPQLVLDNLCEDNATSPEYDFLIVDESQDIIGNQKYLDILDMILHGGLKAGHWSFFGDFDKQAIYLNDVTDPVSILEERTDFTNFRLTDNCRNTLSIASSLQLLCNLDPGYRKILHDQEEPEVTVNFFKKSERQTVHLLDLLRDLKTRFPANQIVVLSTKNDTDCCAALAASKNASFQLIPFRVHSPPPKAIRYGTIHAYKGLEAQAVIVTDVEDLESEHTKNLLYTGLSRAQLELCVLIDIGSINSYQELLKKGLALTKYGRTDEWMTC